MLCYDYDLLINISWTGYMFYLHTSNKTENLLAHLDAVIKNDPKKSPFEKETFLVQSEGMGRWIMQQMAMKNTVFCNYEFLFPNHFLEQVARSAGSHLLDEVFERSNLMWRIYAILCEFDVEPFKTLANYIANDVQGVHKFQLAQQLVNIYDQYQIFRPKLISAWQNDQLLYQNSIYAETEQWQKIIWSRVIKGISPAAKSRNELWQETFQKIKTAIGISALPKRISVFGINTFPDIYLQLLTILSTHIDIHLFLLNPSQEYWVDLPSKKQIALENIDKPDNEQNILLQTNNPLLASFGLQGQHFQELLLLEDRQFQMHFESFSVEKSLTWLHQIQNDMLLNTLTVGKIDPKITDNSICIHSCHTPIRELQVLKNQILYTLTNSEIQLRDILIMAPNIEDYVPYIPAIFSDLKHTLADESLRYRNGLVDIFEKFMKLVTGRFGWQEVLDFLSLSEISKTFDLNDQDIEEITHWVKENNIRWAYSSAHKEQLGLPGDKINTWCSGIEKMFYGYAIGEQEQVSDYLSLYPKIEGQAVLTLGKCYQYLQLLRQAQQDFSTPKTIQQWSICLSEYVNHLFNADEIPQAYKVELLSKLTTLQNKTLAFYQQPVSFQVITQWFQGLSSEVSSAEGFLRGGLTFCSLLPMRSVPFKVIALLGMNEGDFPGRDKYATFDLTQVQFQKGDRSKRLDDKYQFLEILLSARENLWIFYQGQLAENNETVQPSSVVCDLIDVLTEYYGLPESCFVKKHPLQSYHSKYFDEKADKPAYINYRGFDFNIAQKHFEYLTGKPQSLSQQTWWPNQKQLNIELPKVIELENLIRFLKNPQTYFVKQVLQIRLMPFEKVVEESEPFSRDPLTQYQLTEQLVLNGLAAEEMPDNIDDLYQNIQAQGLLLGGEIGRLDFQECYHIAFNYCQKFKTIEPIIGQAADNILFDFSVHSNLIDNVKLVGTLSHQYEYAMVIFRLGELDGKSLLSAWIQHVILNKIRPKKTYLIYSQKGSIIIKTFLPEHTRLSPLEEWVDLFLSGQHQPSSFITEPVFAYIQQYNSKNAKKSPIDKAVDRFKMQLTKSYLPELKQLCQNMKEQEINVLFNETFETLALKYVQPIYEAVGL